jgi:type II secretory ATPase GspE/PulE/Tfp pilus assembly ATPase PilB-like protein/ActR/RegA family two-component response regulator
MEPYHWIVAVARRAPLPNSERLAVPPGTPTEEAWAAACRTCGVSPAELSRYIAQHFRLRVADLDAAENRAIKLVPETVARRFRILPLRENDHQLVVATSDPVDLELERVLGFASGRTPVFAVAPPDAIQRAIDTMYSPDRVVQSLLGNVGAGADSIQVVEEAEPEAIGTAELEAEPVVKLTNVILSDAVRERASDVHIEPGRAGGTVRFRVDGVLRHYMQMPMPALNRVVSRIKILGQMDIADRLRPQDGRARVRVDDRTYDLRISTVPTRDSEKAVIRILDPQAAPGLDQLGLAEPEAARVRHLLSLPDGIFVVTGPTGSGKTTTLYAALRHLATGDVNIMTVEDPIEYELAGVTQIQVESKRGVTFPSALRAILRQDPDVILVGEIRDLETAVVAVQAAMTGHLVLATLHTNDAIGVVARLVDLGLDRASIAAALRGALAQRLLRRVCAQCNQAISGDLTGSEERLARQYGVRPAVRAVGCTQCGNTGFRGRFPVAEVFVATPEVQDLIARGATLRELQHAVTQSGVRPMRESALEAVRQGLTTLEEVERVMGEASVEESAAAPEAEGDLAVLVADDDAVVRQLVRGILAKHGFRVAEAADGRAALERLGAEPFALLILDLDMPRLDGRAVLQQVRQRKATAGLPVVVLTGADDESAEVEVMEAGADDYIRKPIDPPRFVARVKAALRRAAG